MVKNIFLFLLIPAIAFGVELDTNGDGIIDSSYLPANIVNVPEVDGSVTNEIQVGDGVTITGTGTVADPFVAVGGGVETDPSFALWLSTFDPFEAADVPGAETDPAFNAWLIASPPLFAEVDPIFGLWDKSTGISITESQISDFGTYLTAETDPISLKPTDIGVTVQAAGSYLTSESDPSVDSSAEIQSIIGAGVYEPIKGTDDNYVSDAEKALLVYLDDPSEATSEWQLTGASYSVTLNWLDRSSTEDGYIIERKAGIAGTFAYIADVAENIETYVDTTGTLGQDYYYRVAAYTGLDPEDPDTQSGYSGTVKVTMTAPAIDAADVALDDTNENTAEIEVEGAIDEIYGLISGLGGGHDAVTLSALLDSNLFSLSTQELGLDTQTANSVFAGPASGAAAAPAFRALTADDIPALPYLAAEVDGSTTNEINTITGDNATTTSGLAITIAGAGTVSTAVSGDTVTITGTGDGTGTDDQTAAEVPYTNNTSGMTATDTQAAIDEMEGRVDTNDAKVSNVSTALSIGTKTATTLAITSDGGADDVVLPEADTDNAGLIGADKWDEIVANSAARHADESDASTTVKGIIEIADDTEALAGTDTSKAMTAAGVKLYVDTNDDTGTDDQTASEVTVTTTSFGGIFTNDADSNTVQKCLDKADDHTHTTTSISGLDISDDTNLAAGRSLTLSGDSIEADAELYTDTKCIRFESPTAADDFKSIWMAKTACTITSIWAESDQTVTFMLQVDDGSAADVDSVDLAPAAGTAEDTSLNGDVTMAAGDRLDIDLVSVSGTPTWVTICWTCTLDD